MCSSKAGEVSALAPVQAQLLKWELQPLLLQICSNWTSCVPGWLCNAASAGKPVENLTPVQSANVRTSYYLSAMVALLPGPVGRAHFMSLHLEVPR